MRQLVLACAFAAVTAAGSTADANDWYRCMFGGGFAEGYCDYSYFGGVGCSGWRGMQTYGCETGCSGCCAGLRGGFYSCRNCCSSCANGGYCGQICAVSTCCAASSSCYAGAPSCNAGASSCMAMPSCCAPTSCAP